MVWDNSPHRLDPSLLVLPNCQAVCSATRLMRVCAWTILWSAFLISRSSNNAFSASTVQSVAVRACSKRLLHRWRLVSLADRICAGSHRVPHCEFAPSSVHWSTEQPTFTLICRSLQNFCWKISHFRYKDSLDVIYWFGKLLFFHPLISSAHRLFTNVFKDLQDFGVKALLFHLKLKFKW